VRPEFAGFAVSFGGGFDLVFDSDARQFIGIFHRYSPKIALGLAQIGLYDRRDPSRSVVGDVFAAGSHTSIDTRIPIIVDSRNPSFLRTSYPEQDTGAVRMKSFGQTARPEEVAPLFTLPLSALPSAAESAALRESVRSPERKPKQKKTRPPLRRLMRFVRRRLGFVDSMST
jgi:hypothetical protein